MREHHAYRLAISLMFQLPTDGASSHAELGQIDQGGSPDENDPITLMLESHPPADLFGRYWSQELVNGFRSLPRLDANQYLEVRFEDLVSNPKDVLQTISGFFELDVDQGDWIGRAAGLVRGVPPTRFDKLAEEEREQLSEACRVGMQLLGRIA
jgi:hypothetical protein